MLSRDVTDGDISCYGSGLRDGLDPGNHVMFLESLCCLAVVVVTCGTLIINAELLLRVHVVRVVLPAR